MISKMTRWVGLIGLVAAAAAEGVMLVPVRPQIRVRGSWAVKYHRVKMTVRDQIARVEIDQAFVNTGKAPIEVEYLFPVPPGAAITQMTLMADGKELPAKLLAAEDARRIYESIVRKKKDPALLEYVGYGLYKTSVFPLPPGKERRVMISYTVECPKDRDLVKVMYPLNTEKFSARPIEDVRVVVDIRSRRPIGPVYSPSHDLKVERKAADHVIATYRVANAIPNTDFELFYQDGSGDIGATVISHRGDRDTDGYFMALVSPKPRPERNTVMPKDIVFVIDRSGSMNGEKIAQARGALTWILKNLNKEDRFNVVSFSNGVETMFNTALVPADADRTAKAVEMVAEIDAHGGTNIAAALPAAFGLLKADDERPAYVLFLTDGKPTVGKTTDVPEIVKLAKKANAAKARLLNLGVGYDVNTRLLDLLAKANRGLSEYVKPNEALEDKVSGLYAKVRNPVMTDLKVTLADAAVRDLYPTEIGDLFDGQQIVLIGRYGKGGRHDLVITGRYQGDQRAFEYPVELDTFSEDNAAAFLPRIWAMRRVGFLMDQIALHGKDRELIDELIALSRDYGIMTPYTSFLAEEDTKLGDAVALRHRGRASVDMLKADTGWRGQQNAVVRSRLNEAARRPNSSVTFGAGGRADGMAVGGAYGAAPPQTAAPTIIGNETQYAYEAGEAEVEPVVHAGCRQRRRQRHRRRVDHHDHPVRRRVLRARRRQQPRPERAARHAAGR